MVDPQLDHNDTMKLLSPDSAPFFFYAPDAISEKAAADLTAFLDATPRRDYGEFDPKTEFAFVPLTNEESDDVTREEAAAGNPIWVQGDWGDGCPIPDLLVSLRTHVEDAAQTIQFAQTLGFEPDVRFTSVYVDHYQPGGGFFPHTDGAKNYGPVIAGVSVGPGHARFALLTRESVHDRLVADFLIEPRPLYFFCGPSAMSPGSTASTKSPASDMESPFEPHRRRDE